MSEKERFTKKDLSSPPQWMDKLIKRLCPDHLIEEVLGDLHERYEGAVNPQDRQKANRRYFKE